MRYSFPCTASVAKHSATAVPVSPRLVLLALKFDDQLLVYGQIHVFTLGQRQYLAGQICMIHLKPTGGYLVARELCRGFEHCELLAAFADLDLVAHTNLVRRNVHLAAV